MNLILKLPTVPRLPFCSCVPECFPFPLKIKKNSSPLCVPSFFHRYVAGGQGTGGSLERGRALYPRCLASLKTLDMELGSVPVCRHWKHDVSRESSFWFSFSLYLFVYDSFTQKVSLLISFFFFVCLLFSLRTDDSYDQTSESVIFISPFPLFTEKNASLAFFRRQNWPEKN